MRIITRTFTLFIVALVFPLVLFGQSRPVMSDNYFAALKKAESKTDSQIRKTTRTQEFYKSGEIIATITDTTEYLPPNKLRTVSVSEKGDATEKTETISIGNSDYRRTDNGRWYKQEKSSKNFDMGGVKDTSKMEYFIEEEIGDNETFQVLTEKKTNPDGTRTDEIKTWINKEGLIVERTETTSIGDLTNVISSVNIIYEYGIRTLSIEAPANSKTLEKY